MKNTQRASKYQCLSSYQRSPSGSHLIINLKYVHININKISMRKILLFPFILSAMITELKI